MVKLWKYIGYVIIHAGVENSDNQPAYYLVTVVSRQPIHNSIYQPQLNLVLYFYKFTHIATL